MSASVLPLAFIESIGGGELLMVMVIALMLFGGDKLPELARGMGKAMREFKKTTGAMQDELRKAMEEAEAPPPSIMPPASASPEIKSTPGIQPPGFETPAPLADDPAMPYESSDSYGDYHAPDPDPAPSVEAPAPKPDALASDPTPPPPSTPDNPEQRPNPGPGPAV